MFELDDLAGEVGTEAARRLGIKDVNHVVVNVERDVREGVERGLSRNGGKAAGLVGVALEGLGKRSSIDLDLLRDISVRLDEGGEFGDIDGGVELEVRADSGHEQLLIDFVDE